MGGPVVPWRPGRADKAADAAAPLADGLLPDGDKGAAHVRAIFNRMGEEAGLLPARFKRSSSPKRIDSKLKLTLPKLANP